MRACRRDPRLLVTLAVLVAACGSRTDPTTTPDAAPMPAGGLFVWQDLLTDDLEASRRFYGDLLGWEFEETSRFGEPYLLARTVLGYIGGITQVEPETEAGPVAQWLSYARVADIDRVVTEVRARGGQALVEPIELHGGRVAIVADSQGGLLGLSSLELGLPHRDPRVAPAGTFFWRDYLARDIEDAREFYGAVTALAVESQPRSDGQPHYVLRIDREVAGLVPVFTDHITPHWLPYLRVDDPVQLARRAERLGGAVLLAPRADVRNGSLAVVADPRGAVVALQQYPF